MPITDKDTSVKQIPLAGKGINLSKNIVELDKEECFSAQNFIYKNGMVKRGGQSPLTDTEVVANKRITGLSRFYYGTAQKQLLASAGTAIKFYAGSDTWTTIDDTRTDGLVQNMTTWGALNKCYIADGVDVPLKWTGSAVSNVTAAPATTLQFLPYQDRLLSIYGGNLTWSSSFDDTSWETLSNCGVRPDSKLFGMIIHSSSNALYGYEAKVLLAGANGMYLFAGTDLRVPAATGDYTINSLAISSGCNSPRTMCWTPKGTMWLGIDRQVYLLPFGSLIPVPVGQKIQSRLAGVEGIEKISAANLAKASATYHNGYYILSFGRTGQSTNSTQVWLDINRLYQDDDKSFGPWYGLMIGQAISCFANQNGEGDIGQLMGGEDSAKGLVYQLNQEDIYADVEPTDASSKDITQVYTTPYDPLGNPNVYKDIDAIEYELLDVAGTVTVNFQDILGSLRTGEVIPLSGNAYYWNDNYWDEQYWSSSSPTRKSLFFTGVIHARLLSQTINYSSSTDKFELYSIKASVKEQALVFEGAP